MLLLFSVSGPALVMDFGDVVGQTAGGDMQAQLLEMKQQKEIAYDSSAII